MMFYKISKQQAGLIGSFEYDQGKFFSPYVGEQLDGNYLVKESVYDIVCHMDEFKGIVLTEKITKTEAINNLKKQEI